MIRFVLKKLVRTAMTIFLCVTAVFFVLRLSGDPVDALLGPDAPETAREELRIKLGLERPIYEQYADFVVLLAHGDFGTSLMDGREAIEIVLERVPATLELGAAALLVALSTGLTMGIAAALKHRQTMDRAIMSGAVFAFSMPNFFLGILLILAFALHFRVLPSSGHGSFAHLVLPAVTLGLSVAGKLSRFVRSSVLDVLGNPFLRAVKGMRFSSLRVLFRHVLPNALIPVITFLGFEIGLLIGGSVVVETVFGWPGIGSLLAVSVARRDLTVVQAIIFLIALTMISANLLVDLLYGWLDPRVRTQKGDG